MEIRCHEHRIHVTTDLARNGYRSHTQRFVPSVPCASRALRGASRPSASSPAGAMLPVSNA